LSSPPRVRAELAQPPARSLNINILHLVGSGEPGGINSFILQLMRRIDRSRFKLDVCTFGAEGAAFDEMRRLGAEAHAFDATGGYSLAAVLAYFRHLRRSKYRIVHTHVGSRVPRMVARLAGCRTISHAHGMPEPRVDQPRKRLASQLRTSLATGSDSIVACSQHTGDLLAGLCPDLATRVHVRHNGIDLEHWPLVRTLERTERKRALGLSESLIVGFAGRLVPLKRADCLVEAAQSLANQMPAQFVVLGDGPLRGALEQQAACLGDRFRFVGWQESRMWMAAFDLLVLPSESEGLPLCVLEAMACGIPVIATPVGGVPEAVVEGETGLLVPPGDTGALSRAIERLAADSAMRRQMGRAGRHRVEKLFDASAVARRFEALYSRLAASPRTAWA
jgi:glycosyltransferase involved in cell wall biosynthesis